MRQRDLEKACAEALRVLKWARACDCNWLLHTGLCEEIDENVLPLLRRFEREVKDKEAV